MTQPRPEHPRPQFERVDWINLNGEWTFDAESRQPFLPQEGGSDRFAGKTPFSRKIIVPFAPESPLSGIGEKDFVCAMRYHRRMDIPAGWNGKKIFLHFQAVFYRAFVYVDGVRAGAHAGGSSSFSLDLTRFVKPGALHDLVVLVTNNLFTGEEPSGKQSWKYNSYGCFYTRTTGIWQTVWLEAADPCALQGVHIVPDFDNSAFVFTPEFLAIRKGMKLCVAVLDGSKKVASAERAAASGVPFSVPVPGAKPWSPENPHLYDIEFRVTRNKKTIDTVKSYAGMRKIHIEGNGVFLNNRPLYQRLVLDQGFYPDGIWTAPTDTALKRDIELSLAAGFNGARLHQKAFEERFYYWADKLGYLCWAESPSWGLDCCNEALPARNFLAEWRELILRDRNHPSIITWTPFNETLQSRDPMAHERVHIDAYRLCKALDPTRPVNDASGYVHHITDLWTVHNYIQDPAKFSEILSPDREGGVFRNVPNLEPPYEGQPYLIDEFGGIKWNPAMQAAPNHKEVSWGYGDTPKSVEEFYARLAGLVEVILSKKHIAGYCYTQLTDVEQEQNGIYYYDRTEKFDMKRIHAVFSQTPTP